jgi:hypothetical protein
MPSHAVRTAWSLLYAALAPALFTPAAHVASAPTLPSWVKAALVLKYTDNLGGYVDYDYTDTVSSVSRGVVKVTTYQWSPGVVGTGKSSSWTCPAVCTGTAAQTSAQFWVDPSNPVGSLSGGKWPYRYLGVVNYVLRGATWRAGELYYPSAHGPVVTYFQARTGLVLYHKEYGYSLLYHVLYAIQLTYQGTQG